MRRTLALPTRTKKILNLPFCFLLFYFQNFLILLLSLFQKGRATRVALPFWSRRRESDPPKSAWEADAIPIGDACVITFYTIAQPQ